MYIDQNHEQKRESLTKLDEMKLCLYTLYIQMYIVMFLCTYVHSEENKDIIVDRITNNKIYRHYLYDI